MTQFRLLTFCFLVVLFPSASQVAAAQNYCFEEAGRLYGIAPALLWAISKEESGFSPHAINFNMNGTYDYCHMQINSSWSSEIGNKVWASLGDPCQCTKVGAWILSRCVRDHDYTWEAVGCYHAKDKTKRVEYAWKIHGVLSKYVFMHKKVNSRGSAQ